MTVVMRASGVRGDTARMPKNPFRIVAQIPGFTDHLIRKPRLVTSVLKQRAMKKVRARRGLETLAGIEYATTYACQATCEHCSAASLFDPDREKGRLSTPEIRRLGQQAISLGVYEVNLTGGEPTLLKNLPELVECFAPHRTFIGVNTNGMLLDEEHIDRLWEAGVDLLKLSLDSDDPDEHDSNRGLEGCYEHVLEILDIVRHKKGIRGHICSVGTSEAIRSGAAARLVQLAEERDATIGFTLPAAVGRWGGRYELMLPREDLEELRDVCRHPRAFFQGSVGMQAFRCPAGRDEIYVSPYGDVLPCPFVQRSFGSVREESLGRIFDRMGQATELAGKESLCLAGESIRWMKQNVPSSVERLSEMPTCATEHGDSFCRDEVKPGDAGKAWGSEVAQA